MSTQRNAGDCLRDYLQAMAAKNTDAIASLFDKRALLEIPFLKPNRLIGDREIDKAHRQIFASLESILFTPENIASDGRQAIAAGRLEFTRGGGECRRLDAALVAEAAAGNLQRLSLYCDARNLRPWSDRAIF